MVSSARLILCARSKEREQLTATHPVWIRFADGYDVVSFVLELWMLANLSFHEHVDLCVQFML